MNIHLERRIVLENQHGLVRLNVLEIVDQPAGNPSVHRSQQSRVIKRALRGAQRRIGHVGGALGLLKLALRNCAAGLTTDVAE